MYKIKCSREVYQNRWMELYEDSVIDEQNALVGIFNRIKVDDAAIVVPEFEDGSLLMVENYRHGIKGNLFELPGGLIKNEDKEQPSDTARRELIEETGYICDILEYIGWFYTWPARSTQRNFVFVARGLKKAQAIQNLVQNQLDEFEYIRLYKISKREVLQKIKKGNIQSAITISALFYTFFLRI